MGDSEISKPYWGYAPYRAFLYYDSTFGMTNLDALIKFATNDDRDEWLSTSTNTSAVGINSDNDVSGQGKFNGVYRAFVLIAAPVER